jgi:hypothetical protein
VHSVAYRVIPESSVCFSLRRFHDPCLRVRHYCSLDAIPDNTHRREQSLCLSLSVKLQINHDSISIINGSRDLVSPYAQLLPSDGIAIESLFPTIIVPNRILDTQHMHFSFPRFLYVTLKCYCTVLRYRRRCRGSNGIRCQRLNYLVSS